MSKQPPSAPTESTIGPYPTVSQVSRTPWHWKFTQHLRTTRPPPINIKSTSFGYNDVDSMLVQRWVPSEIYLFILALHTKLNNLRNIMCIRTIYISVKRILVYNVIEFGGAWKPCCTKFSMTLYCLPSSFTNNILDLLP